MQPYFKGLISNGGALTTTTTNQNIPNLTFDLVTGGTYRFYTAFNYQATAASCVILPGMGGTSTPSFLCYQINIQTNAGGGGGLFTDNVLNNAARQSPAATTTLSANLIVFMAGIITVSAAGTLTAICARTSAASNINIQSGGRFTLEQIA